MASADAIARVHYYSLQLKRATQNTDEGMTMMKFTVIDATSSWFGKTGVFISKRGGKLRLLFKTTDRWGDSETFWHFSISQVEFSNG